MRSKARTFNRDRRGSLPSRRSRRNVSRSLKFHGGGLGGAWARARRRTGVLTFGGLSSQQSSNGGSSSFRPSCFRSAISAAAPVRRDAVGQSGDLFKAKAIARIDLVSRGCDCYRARGSCTARGRRGKSCSLSSALPVEVAGPYSRTSCGALPAANPCAGRLALSSVWSGRAVRGTPRPRSFAGWCRVRFIERGSALSRLPPPYPPVGPRSRAFCLATSLALASLT